MISYRPEVDGLRAVAISSVVLFHAGIGAFSGGYVGVDVFFVISGYLITSIILNAEKNGGFSYLDFYARRARRILPALLCMAAIVTVLCLAIFLPLDLVDYGKILIYTVLFGANFRLTATPGYFDTASQENPLLHMWSLSVEEQFYLAWPTLLVLMMVWLSPRGRRLAVLTLAAVSLLASIILVEVWPKSAFYHLPSRGWELLAGAALAMGLLGEVRNKTTAEALAAAGFAMMLLPVIIYTKETPFPGLAALPPVLGCAAIIHAETAHKTWVGALLSLSPVVFVGLISYSLYLWHWPVFAFPTYVLMREMTGAETGLLIAAAIVISTLSWRYVERPFRNRPRPAVIMSPNGLGWRDRIRNFPLRPVGYAALAVTACLVACGSYFQESRGAGWRLSASALELSRKFATQPYTICARETKPQKDLTVCEMGKRLAEGENPKVILWGDSHAQHYEPLIASLYKEGAAYLHSGCSPVVGVYQTYRTLAGFPQTCMKNKNATWEKIKEAKPKLVILAGRWDLTERFPYGLEVHGTYYYVHGADDPRTIEHSREVFKEALTSTVNKLTDQGIKVLIMGEVPGFKIPIGRCLAVSQYLGLNPAPCLSIARSAVEERQAFSAGVVQEIVASNQNVALFWPRPFFCDGERCRAEKDGVNLYRDTSHLMPEGAMALAPLFRATVPKEFQQLGDDVTVAASASVQASP